MADLIAYALIAGVVLAIVLAAATPKVIAWIDRAPERERDGPKAGFDGAAYAENDSASGGWDGWYLFCHLEAAHQHASLNAVRLSVMTGAYGVEGIDARTRPQSIPAGRILERLLLVYGEKGVEKHHEYLDQAVALQRLDPDRTEIRLRDELGAIEGAWPEYHVHLVAQDLDVEVELKVRAERVAWWADAPRIFTYASAFGVAQGTLRLAGERCPIRGRCSFEHGYARALPAPWLLTTPILALRRVLPIPVARYMYNLFFLDDGSDGGIMRAEGLGIRLRDLGTLFLASRTVQLSQVRVTLEEVRQSSGLLVPLRWRVDAAARDGGFLTYQARLEGQEARIAENMIYFTFSLDGALLTATGEAVPLRGCGYGEYVDL